MVETRNLQCIASPAMQIGELVLNHVGVGRGCRHWHVAWMKTGAVVLGDDPGQQDGRHTQTLRFHMAQRGRDFGVKPTR